jgi:hypothetical protein
MLIIRNASEVLRITHLGIRSLVALRFGQLNSPDGPDAPEAKGYFVVVEASDSVSEIEQAAGYPLLRSLLDDIPFGHMEFQPSTEIFEEHLNEYSRIYEMVFISNDNGAFTTIFIEEGVGPADMLLMCRSFATPAVSTP